MKISVLIAAHRPTETLGATLACVSAQMDAEWDIVIVADGAREISETIVRQFGATHPISYEHLPEARGIVSLRNRLLELATGDALAFLEPGDTWTSRHLANATRLLHAGADVVVSDARIPSPKPVRPPGEAVMPPQLSTSPTRTLFARDVIPSQSCAVVRRATALKVGRFDPRFGGGEGRDFWLRCALAGARFMITQRQSCLCARPELSSGARAAQDAEQAVLFYEKHRDLAAIPAALRRRLLAGSLVAQGRLLRVLDPSRAARCFWRAWSLQPVHVQTLGQFALTGWAETAEERKHSTS